MELSLINAIKVWKERGLEEAKRLYPEHIEKILTIMNSQEEFIKTHKLV